MRFYTQIRIEKKSPQLKHTYVNTDESIWLLQSYFSKENPQQWILQVIWKKNRSRTHFFFVTIQFLLKNMGFPTNSIKHLYKNVSINILMQFGCNIKSQTKRIIIKFLIVLKKLSIF